MNPWQEEPDAATRAQAVVWRGMFVAMLQAGFTERQAIRIIAEIAITAGLAQQDRDKDKNDE